MSGRTSIEWTQRTWNPIKARLRAEEKIVKRDGTFKVLPAGTTGYHCELVGPDCTKCYACAGNRRMLPGWGTGLDYTRPSRDKVQIFVDAQVLGQPFNWRNPQMVFPCSMTDLFGDFVPDEDIAEVFRVMARTPWHTYQLVTKRADRMAELWPRLLATFGPLPHVWPGVSVGTVKGLERLAHLRRVDAAIRWVSFEPLLEDLGDFDVSGIAWAVLGLESGPGARGEIDHLTHLLGHLQSHRVPAFVKQLGSRYARIHALGDGSGGDIDEWPKRVRVRQWPAGFIPPAQQRRKARAA